MIQCVQVVPIAQVAEAKKDEKIEVEVEEATPAAADVNQPEQKVTPRVWMENIYENQNDASQSLSPCLSFTMFNDFVPAGPDCEIYWQYMIQCVQVVSTDLDEEEVEVEEETPAAAAANMSQPDEKVTKDQGVWIGNINITLT